MDYIETMNAVERPMIEKKLEILTEEVNDLRHMVTQLANDLSKANRSIDTLQNFAINQLNKEIDELKKRKEEAIKTVELYKENLDE